MPWFIPVLSGIFPVVAAVMDDWALQIDIGRRMMNDLGFYFNCHSFVLDDRR